MSLRTAGVHHAVAGYPQRNLDFYEGVLGLRLVKKTVNFDDPGTYHLYYGDEVGRPERQDSRDALEARDRDKPYSTVELDFVLRPIDAPDFTDN